MQIQSETTVNVKDIIERKVDDLPNLASLRSINAALGELTDAEVSFTSQIAEIIRRDPSLTSRLLKLVNSVFFGLSRRVNDIENAVFFLGLKQIRELALATPVIEDFEKLNLSHSSVNWRLLWQQSIGAAILTKEILSMTDSAYEGDTDYILGLVHNVGKIVIAFAFPNEFEAIYDEMFGTPEEVCIREAELIGWDHARIGSYYLQKHQLSGEIVEAVCYQFRPDDAPTHTKGSAAIHLADNILSAVNITGIHQTKPVHEDDWPQLQSWPILFGSKDPEEIKLVLASLKHTLRRLPTLLHDMI